MKKLPTFFLSCCIVFCAASCDKHEKGYKTKLNVKVAPAEAPAYYRYEDVLFSLDTANFQSELMKIQPDYLPFLEGDLNDPEAVKYLKDFATDPYILELYQHVRNSFPNLDFVRKSVEGVYAHFHHYYPDLAMPKNVYTCVTGISMDIPPIQIIDDNMVISLDWYLGQDSIYSVFGWPRYKSERTGKKSMTKDIAMCFYNLYLFDGRSGANLSEEMINAGKAYYFIEAMAPKLEDDILLGYTPAQMKWANDNEGELWADIVGNQRLFSSGLDMHMTFFADGPFTQEYSHEAPARLGEFIGLQIIRSYMANNDISLQQLINEKDFQGIFQASGYKPRK